MKWMLFLFGEGKDLNVLQMVDRTLIAFLLTLFMIRVAGMRTFGKRSALDNVILILLGAVMSRAIVGASPFVPVVAACFAMSMVHRFFSWLSVQDHALGRWVKGRCICLYKDGKLLTENMRKAMISENDIREGIRLSLNEEGFDNVREVYLERNGELGVVKKSGVGSRESGVRSS